MTSNITIGNVTLGNMIKEIHNNLDKLENKICQLKSPDNSELEVFFNNIHPGKAIVVKTKEGLNVIMLSNNADCNEGKPLPFMAKRGYYLNEVKNTHGGPSGYTGTLVFYKMP